jgi:hypothetical protein
MIPELYGFSTVLIGNFNPKIFQPAWFAAQGLIRELEAQEAKTEIIHQDITIFSLDWLRLEVTRDRFNVSTEQEAYFQILADFVIGTFRILEHTPAGIMGINSSIHYRLSSEEKWHSIGDTLAPKEPWKDILKKPGMLRVEMQEERKEEPKGFLRVRVEPSKKCHPGIFVNCNDHYEVPNPSDLINCTDIIQIFQNNWLKSTERSKNIAEKIIK